MIQLNIFNKENYIIQQKNDMNKIQEYLQLLEETGWSELIDSRWEEDVIRIIKNYDSNAKEEDIKQLLKLVIYEGQYGTI